jgi:collagenase-like PrtC family protease
LEALKAAVVYGADAVYIGGEAFGLRAKAKNFTVGEMQEGISFAHGRGVKVYVTANILAHNADLGAVEAYFRELGGLGGAGEPCRPDALIISDPGVFDVARRVLPDMDIHISTQANNTNIGTFLFWRRMGAKRMVAARELTLSEIAEIRQGLPGDMEIECFVHGAMCISYSGRCLLSAYLTGRDANQGNCSHPCRWKYTLNQEAMRGVAPSLNQEAMWGEPPTLPKRGVATPLHQAAMRGECTCATDGDAGGWPGCKDPAQGASVKAAYLAADEVVYALSEETRPGEYFPVFENERGTFIFNSKDLCMIGHLPELMAAGVDSLKIEGRMKSALYVATMARAYRKALDDMAAGEGVYRENLPWYMDEISKCTFREYTTGFYFGKAGEEAQIYGYGTYVKNYAYLGMVGEGGGSAPGLTGSGGRGDAVPAGELSDGGHGAPAGELSDGRYGRCADARRVGEGGGGLCIVQKNKFSVGDAIEVMKPDGRNIQAHVRSIRDTDGNELDSAPHSRQVLYVDVGVGAGSDMGVSADVDVGVGVGAGSDMSVSADVDVGVGVGVGVDVSDGTGADLDVDVGTGTGVGVGVGVGTGVRAGVDVDVSTGVRAGVDVSESERVDLEEYDILRMKMPGQDCGREER